MGWYLNLYALVLMACALASSGVAVYAWRHRSLISAGPALTLLATTVWSVGYAIATGVQDPAWRILWAKVQHLGIALAPVALIVTVLHYTGREKWLTWRNLILISAVPAVGMLLAWTNEWHGLIWKTTTLRVVQIPLVGPLSLLQITYGPYFWFYTTFNNLCVLVTAALFLQAMLRSSHLRRRQAAILLAGVLISGVAILLYLLGNLTGWSLLPELDLAPLGYSLSGLVLVWGLLRYRLFDIVPVARERLIEEMGDGVFVLDEQRRVIDANPAMLEILGRPVGEIIGQPAHRILSAQPDLVERYLDRREAHDEIAMGTGDKRRYFDLRLSPLYGQRKQLVGRVIVLRDITERRKGEEEREQLIGELDAFAHTVAHDLKTPLASVIGYAEMVESSDQTLPAAQQKHLRSIIWMGYKMANIIDELLLLASIRKESIQIHRLDMGRIVAEALRRLAFAREERRAQIELPPEWPAALGYASWVEEVWVNYISNAIKYGGRPPQVQLGAEVLTNGMVRFWVRDNGLGVAAEDQAGLFLPFAQVGQAKAQGQGLGLSIVRHIVERLGGEVGVESAAGQGSMFFFTLPPADRAAR